MSTNSERLLERVARRKYLALNGWWIQRLTLFLSAVAAVLILATLLFNFANPWAVRGVVLLVPVAAMLTSFSLVRRIKFADAARLVDTHLATKDLFLTTAMLDDTAGAYQPLVAQQADKLADTVPPSKVVPFPWEIPACRTGLVLGTLLATTFIPTFDLAGHDEQDDPLHRHKERLVKQEQNARRRVEELNRVPLGEPQTADVTHALDKLAEAFKRMRPDNPKFNQEQLKAQQAALGAKWRRTKEQLSSREDGRGMGQRFGGLSKQGYEIWQRQLANSDTSGMQQEIQAIHNLAVKLAKATDATKQRGVRDAIRDRLENLANFVSTQSSTPGLDAALEQAMQQMELGRLDELSDQAAEAFDQSMKLSLMELSSLAQTLSDLSSLETAMNTLTTARQLNEMQPLDAASCSDCKTMADYEGLYETMMSKQVGGAQQCGACQGKATVDACIVCGGGGDGMNGLGQGNRGVPPEDDTVITDFKAERTNSLRHAGEILMSWETRDLAPVGKAKEDYTAAIRKVKQAYSEAIVQERVPPKHHASIRRYFDTMQEQPSGHAPPQASP